MLDSRVVGLFLAPVAPQAVHKLESGSTSSCARCFLTTPHLTGSSQYALAGGLDNSSEECPDDSGTKLENCLLQ